MKKTIDACGLTCPAPVLLVKDAVEQTNEKNISVLVDNEASLENVGRFLSSKGYSVTTRQEGGIFQLEAIKDNALSSDSMEKPQITMPEETGRKILVLIANDCLGTGDDALGEKLMISYLKTLKEMGTDLWQLIFINGGVKLTTASSPVLQELQEYEKSGVIILACGTCLEHFALTAAKKVGSTTNMLDIVTAIQLADKVVTLS